MKRETNEKIQSRNDSTVILTHKALSQVTRHHALWLWLTKHCPYWPAFWDCQSPQCGRNGHRQPTGCPPPPAGTSLDLVPTAASGWSWCTTRPLKTHSAGDKGHFTATENTQCRWQGHFTATENTQQHRWQGHFTATENTQHRWQGHFTATENTQHRWQGHFTATENTQHRWQAHITTTENTQHRWCHTHTDNRNLQHGWGFLFRPATLPIKYPSFLNTISQPEQHTTGHTIRNNFFFLNHPHTYKTDTTAHPQGAEKQPM